MTLHKFGLWLAWVGLIATLSTYLALQLFAGEQKPDFLIGETSHGHYQIEMQCSVCHTEPFGGQGVLQTACVGCHDAELRVAKDSHPKSKFTDPRNADRLAILDARYCVTCHREHVEERTQSMAVTLPVDLCFYCHSDIGDNRTSHEELAFDTCASSGCHNYHDNRVLYEDFLVANATGPWLDSTGLLPSSGLRQLLMRLGKLPESPAHNALPTHHETATAAIQQQWQRSAHAAAEVGCNSCHGSVTDWQDHPPTASCADCHQPQVATFQSGKHGMRLAQSLSPMTPGLAREQSGHLAFRDDSLEQELGCSSCHDVHTVDTRVAAVQSCLGCHNDRHSLAFESSPHGRLWQQVEAGTRAANAAVSCASCHLPRQTLSTGAGEYIGVQHNQNDTLRPNEKMIRPVCMICHSLSFSIDALADQTLIDNNFTGQPASHIESIDMAVKRRDAPRDVSGQETDTTE